MLSRREFIGAACCLVQAGPALASGRGRSDFICTTADEDPQPPSGPYPRVRATFHPPERWLPGHGSTPSTGVVTLNVHFMNGTAAQQSRVRQVASEWLRGGLDRRMRLVFGTGRRGSHIRVRFDPQGSNSSEVGAKARRVDATKPTLKLAEVTRRAVLHEFGHALGLRHEHHHPDAGIVWNRRAVVADLRSRGVPNPEQWAQNNVFTRFDRSYSCEGSAFDRNSVMLYPVDRSWTLNGFSSTFNESISTGDRRCLLRVYRVAEAEPDAEQGEVAVCGWNGAARGS